MAQALQISRRCRSADTADRAEGQPPGFRYMVESCRSRLISGAVQQITAAHMCGWEHIGGWDGMGVITALMGRFGTSLRGKRLLPWRRRTKGTTLGYYFVPSLQRHSCAETDNTQDWVGNEESKTKGSAAPMPKFTPHQNKSSHVPARLVCYSSSNYGSKS